MLLVLGANDNEPMSEDQLNAVLLMASYTIPELRDVMPEEIFIFGEKFLVVGKQ